MWFASDNDEWLTESHTPAQAPQKSAGSNDGDPQKREPVVIPSENADNDEDLRNLPEAPPCSIRK